MLAHATQTREREALLKGIAKAKQVGLSGDELFSARATLAIETEHARAKEHARAQLLGAMSSEDHGRLRISA